MLLHSYPSQLANLEFGGVGGTGKKESSFLWLEEGQICAPKGKSGWRRGALQPQEGAAGPTAALTGARRGAARSGLGLGRRAHLHLGRTVRPLSSVTNRMSSPPGFSPCPAPSSVASSLFDTSARQSARPRGAVCPSVCPTRVGAEPGPGQGCGSGKAGGRGPGGRRGGRA